MTSFETFLVVAPFLTLVGGMLLAFVVLHLADNC